MYAASRQKTGAPRPGGLNRHLESRDSCKSPPVREAFVSSTVQHIQQSSFSDLCQIYPCRTPSIPDDQLQQCAAGEAGDAGQSYVDVAANVDHLRTVDIVSILLQPAILDTVVTELENRFLSE